MILSRVRDYLPQTASWALALLSAILMIVAFPDFEIWPLAWIGLIPFLWAIEREKESVVASFVTGWIFGTIFFFGTCWWLTFAPINYAGFPPALAYFLLFCVTVVVGLFPALFAGLLSILLKRYGNIAILAAPFVWVFTEFLRYWITGNNWNAIAYSQAFGRSSLLELAGVGGIYLSGFVVLTISVCLYALLPMSGFARRLRRAAAFAALVILSALWLFDYSEKLVLSLDLQRPVVIAVQPNVPMAGLNYDTWQELRRKHASLAESALKSVELNPQSAIRDPQSTVIFPESPMNFMYDEDPEFREFVSAFAAKNNVNVLFNSAEPDAANRKYFNSAVLVDNAGKEVAQYDKIYLLPFGEAVPWPLQSIVPAFVGSFSYGKEFDLLPLGDAKAGIMICFESHFGEMSREYVRNGADVLIEMTNDGYLGPTPVLRQHLANAVFRAVETNRPVLRVTNVGITAYINERGEVLDPTQGYTEDTRVWSVAKSDGSQTFYVKYGDWFAWLCSMVTIMLTGLAFRRNTSKPPQVVLTA